VDRWCSEWRQPRGMTITLEQGWDLAYAWHSDRLNPDWRRPTIDAVEALLERLGLTGAFWNLRT
jgi:hypothetical protein